MAQDLARTVVASGTTVLACTPHIKVPTYLNDSSNIEIAVQELRSRLAKEEIPLKLVIGADIHIRYDLLEGLKSGALPTLNGTRYFLFEPSHDVMPPSIDRFCASILDGGFVPVLTHPERLTWIEQHYDVVCKLDQLGVAIQLTAGSITGIFGKRAQYWSERMLKENRVDIVASDAHNQRHRTTSLTEVKTWLTEHYGLEYALQLLQDNPQRILLNQALIKKEPHATALAPQKSAVARFVDRLVGK